MVLSPLAGDRVAARTEPVGDLPPSLEGTQQRRVSEQITLGPQAIVDLRQSPGQVHQGGHMALGLGQPRRHRVQAPERRRLHLGPRPPAARPRLIRSRLDLAVLGISLATGLLLALLGVRFFAKTEREFADVV